MKNKSSQRTRLRRMKQDGRMRVVDQSSHSKLSMVVVAQLVRASDCGSEGREFESPQSPNTRCSSVR